MILIRIANAKPINPIAIIPNTLFNIIPLCIPARINHPHPDVAVIISAAKTAIQLVDKDTCKPVKYKVHKMVR